MDRSQLASRPRSFSAGNAARRHQVLKQTVSDPDRLAKQDSPDRRSPVSTSSSSSSSPGTNANRYKTELCRTYQESGACKYGDKCQFAHGTHELRSLPRHPKYKTELCRTFHSSGYCPYGPRCHFVHKPEERRTVESNQMLNDTTLPKEKWTAADSSPPPSPFSDTSAAGGSLHVDRVVVDDSEVFVYPFESLRGSLTDITHEADSGCSSDTAGSVEVDVSRRGVSSLSDSVWSLGSTNSLDEAVNYRVFGPAGANPPFFHPMPAAS